MSSLTDRRRRSRVRTAKRGPDADEYTDTARQRDRYAHSKQTDSMGVPHLPSRAAVRCGTRTACILMMAVGVAATWSVLNGIAPSEERPIRNTLLLVLFLNLMVMLLLVVATLFSRKQAKPAIEQGEPEDAQRQQTGLLGQAVLITQLFDALAHELKQPLTSILINAQAALRLPRRASEEPDEVREILIDIMQEDRRAADVLEHLRALILPRPASKQPIDLNAVIHELSQLLQSELRARRITVKSELDPTLRPVLTERVQVERILLGLIINACACMTKNDPQPRELRLATRSLPELRAIEISVGQCGNGSPDEVAWPMDPQFATHRDRRATGLDGARSIAEALGGRLSAVVNDEGTIVRLTLPAS